MMADRQLVCLQIHNDYQIPGGETKTAHLIADLLERHGVRVIRYYKTNAEYEKVKGVFGKLRIGFHSLNNPNTTKEIEAILNQNRVDFALVHNVISVISNAAYKELIKRDIPIIKYLQNYNLVCLNGALDNGEYCKRCERNNIVGVKCGCYKGSKAYSFIKYLIKKDLDRNILQNIAAFMPNSRFVMNEHVRRGIDERKMHVMHNYVNIPEIKYEGARDFFLYFGRLASEKGVLTTLSAFEKMQNIKLVVMGSGPLEKEVKQRVEKSNNIEFIGSKEGQEILEYVARAKAVIVPSEWDEPLPRTILESYSQGTPVIGADRGGIPELIREKETGYIFESSNQESLLRTVQLFDNMGQKEYNIMRESCLSFLKEHYSEEAYFERFMTCVREIV